MKIYLIVLLFILFKFNLFSFSPYRQKGETEKQHYDRISNTFLYGWRDLSAIENNDRRPELQMKDGGVIMDYGGIGSPMRPFIFTKEDADYIRATYSTFDILDHSPKLPTNFARNQDDYNKFKTNYQKLVSMDVWRRCMVRTKFGKDTIIPQMDKIVRVHFIRIRGACCILNSIRFRLESNPYLRNASAQYRNFHFNNDPNKKDDIHRLRLAHLYHQGKIEYAQKREEEIKKFAIQYWGRKRLSDYNVNWSFKEHLKSNKLEEAFEAVSIKDNGRVSINGKDLEDVHKSLLTRYYLISQRIAYDTLPTRTDLKYNSPKKSLELPYNL